MNADITMSDNSIPVAFRLVVDPDISNLATKQEVLEVRNQIPEINHLATKQEVSEVRNQIPEINHLATKQEVLEVRNQIPVNISELNNDENYLTNEKFLEKKSIANIFESCELSDNSELYNIIYERLYSSCDFSKILFFGSHTVDNSCLIRFYNSDRISIAGNFDFVNAESFEIEWDWKSINGNQSGDFYIENTDLVLSSQISNSSYNNESGSLVVKTPSDNEATIVTYQTPYLKANLYTKKKIVFTGEKYSLQVKNELTNNIWIEIAARETSEKLNLDNLQLFWGCPNDENSQMNGQELRLTNIRIKINNKEVYNCLKTGVDTLKPDNYTLVGNPNITNERVIPAKNQYINPPTAAQNAAFIPNSVLQQIGQNNWILTWKGKFNNTPVSGEYIIGSYWSENILSPLSIGNFNTNPTFYWSINLNIDGIPTKSANYNTIYGSSRKGQSYSAEFKFVKNADSSGGTYSLTLFFEDGTSAASSLDSEYYFAPSTYNLGLGLNIEQDFDLNTVHLYINDDLVYQPCLKIPYTHAKTGSKIVDVQYRDRVFDLYEQVGCANYYTIDEQKQNYTLPMGEIYGFIRKLADRIYNLENQMNI